MTKGKSVLTIKEYQVIYDRGRENERRRIINLLKNVIKKINRR